MSDVPAPVICVRGAAVEPERFVTVKPEVQIGLGLQNHDPSAQRTYTEELRREPITDKYVQQLLLLLLTQVSLHLCMFFFSTVINHHYSQSINHSCKWSPIYPGTHAVCTSDFLSVDAFFSFLWVIPS